MPRELSISRAKARFAELVRRAEGGDSVILTRHGRPVAHLGPTERQDARAFARGEVREPTRRYEAERPVSAAVSATGPSTGPAARSVESRREALARLLQESVWTRVPEDQLGARPDRREQEKILGYGSDGV